MSRPSWIAGCVALVSAACSSPSEGTTSGGHGSAGTEGADTLPPLGSPPPVDASSPGYMRLLSEATRIEGAVKVTSYSHTTTIDEATGTFDVDCSGFVDYALERSVPDAWSALVAGTRSRPLASSYVKFLGTVTAPKSRWTRIATAAELVPGDIIAWLEPPTVTTTNTGHVMIVAAPVQTKPAGVEVVVDDSTETPHGSTDTRAATKSTGVGRGTIILIVDASGAPTGYHWSTDAGSKPQTTTVALGHLQ